jgi:hypothetical protein
VISGQAGHRYDLLIREAQRHDVVEGKGLAGKLSQGELDIWSFAGKPGEFRLLEVEKEGLLSARLLYAPIDQQSEERIARPGARPEIEFLPVASRGGRLRFAAILGREGRYELQLLAQTSATYKLTARDPSQAIELEREVEGGLPVGGAAFYSFRAAPGQLLEASLASQKFVPVLRLYGAQGSLVASSGDSPDSPDGRLTHMVVSEGLYRLQVASLGDGGGGDFRLTVKETKVKEVQVGGRGEGTLRPSDTDFWAFTGKAGQTVFLSVRSSAFEPVVSLRSPDGVRLTADNQGSAETGSLVALKLPKTGKYTVWVAAGRGAGNYAVRLIDGD